MLFCLSVRAPFTAALETRTCVGSRVCLCRPARARRRAVADTLARELPSCRVVFVESICDDESVLERNLRQKIEMSPDYSSMDTAAALADLRERIVRSRRACMPMGVPQARAASACRKRVPQARAASACRKRVPQARAASACCASVPQARAASACCASVRR
jgi:hypothetical protein